VRRTDPLYISTPRARRESPKRCSARNNGRPAVALHWSLRKHLWSPAGRGVLTASDVGLGGRPFLQCSPLLSGCTTIMYGESRSARRMTESSGGHRVPPGSRFFHRNRRCFGSQREDPKGGLIVARSQPLPRYFHRRRASRSTYPFAWAEEISGAVIDHWWADGNRLAVGANCLGIEQCPVKARLRHARRPRDGTCACIDRRHGGNRMRSGGRVGAIAVRLPLLLGAATLWQAMDRLRGVCIMKASRLLSDGRRRVIERRWVYPRDDPPPTTSKRRRPRLRPGEWRGACDPSRCAECAAIGVADTLKARSR